MDTTRQSSRFTAMYSAIPSSSTGAKAGEGWLHTAAVSDGAVRVFGLDCEMVLCGDHGPSLARVSLVRITPPPTSSRYMYPACWGGSTHCHPHCGDAGHAKRRSCRPQRVCIEGLYMVSVFPRGGGGCRWSGWRVGPHGP